MYQFSWYFGRVDLIVLHMVPSNVNVYLFFYVYKINIMGHMLNIVQKNNNNIPTA